MFGDFQSSPDAPRKEGASPPDKEEMERSRRRRFIDEPDIVDIRDHIEAGNSYFGKFRKKRQNPRANDSYSRGHGAPNSIPQPPMAKNLTIGR